MQKNDKNYHRQTNDDDLFFKSKKAIFFSGSHALDDNNLYAALVIISHDNVDLVRFILLPIMVPLQDGLLSKLYRYRKHSAYAFLSDSNTT